MSATEPRFVTTTEQRLGRYGLAANVWVAYDNVDTIADHVLGLIGTGRRMTVIRRYLNLRRSEDNRERVEAVTSGELDVKTGLYVGSEAEYRKPIDRWSQSNPVGKGLHIHLSPGIEGFGFGAYEYENPTEERAAERYNGKDGTVFNRREDVTRIRTSGEPGYPRHTDRIVIETWNQHGVGIETTIAFEDDGPNDEVKRMAEELLDVVDYGGKTTPYWRTGVVARAAQVLGVTIEQAKAGKRRP